METAVNLTNDRFFERQKSTALLPPKNCKKITKSTDGEGLKTITLRDCDTYIPIDLQYSKYISKSKLKNIKNTLV